MLQPYLQLCDLVDPGDGAASDLGEFSIDLGCRCLCNPARGLREPPIDVKAAVIYRRAQHPQCVLRRQQRAQDVIDLALDLHILAAIFAEPSTSVWIIEIKEAFRFFILPPLSRPRHLQHQLFASGIFAVSELQHVC